MQKKMISIIIIAIIIFFIENPLQAQQTRVDSIINLLNKSNKTRGVDTIIFNMARQLISSANLSYSHINQIEKAGDQFKKGNDEDLCYTIKFAVLENLSISDKFKAIEYGKLNFQKLENSQTTHAKYLAQLFLTQLRLPYRNSTKLTEGFQFFTEKLNQYKLAKDSFGLSTCYYVLGGFYRQTGLYESAMYNMKKSTSFLDSSDFNGQTYLDFSVNSGKPGWLNNGTIIADYYLLMGEYENTIKQSELILKTTVDYYKGGGNGVSGMGVGLLFGTRHLALAKIMINQLDSVDYYLKLAANSGFDKVDKSAIPVILEYRSLYDIKRGAYAEADSLLQQCWKLVIQDQIPVAPPSGYVEPDYYLALLRIEQRKFNEAITLLLKNIERVKSVRKNVLRDYKLLATLYEKTGDNIKAKEVYKSFIKLQDSITVDQSKFRTLSFETEQHITDNEIAISKLESENKLSTVTKNFTIGIAVLFILLAGTIFFRFKSKQKANQVLQEQKEKVESTLAELKSTQSQLIQSEKMASLGELTAGIAHEIQNPLNFVNNFSEVNKELLVELKAERLKPNGDRKEDIENELIDDVISNEEKINHHGKRADAIVKGMLQHSRSSSGQKEPADINALCDEYLRLAYHGLRAKDNSFNASFETKFDDTIGMVNIQSQEMGRVILNLINNAFYAVATPQPPKGGVDVADKKYKPTVTISTSIITPPSGGRGVDGRMIMISVKDNGPGIPPNIVDKIFQPFFTTKPTGQGTGLGLRLSYDIVKAHGGELKVETREGEGSQFTISIPV